MSTLKWTIFIVLAALILAGPAWANHGTIPQLKEGFIALPADCPIGKGGLLEKDSPKRVSCVFVANPEDEGRFWVIIEDARGEASYAIEVNTKTKGQKIIWRNGEQNI